ncbi:MAG: hypothetical protein QM501_06835 [Gimesia sp.]
MNDLILTVSDIDEQCLGKAIRVKGMAYCHDFVCWLVPPNTEQSMDSKKEGILLKLPGLGAEAEESKLSRVKNGSPMVKIEEVELIGHLVALQNNEYKAVIDNIEFVIFRGNMKESILNLSNIRNISEYKQSMIDSLDDENSRERYRAKCFSERQL